MTKFGLLIDGQQRPAARGGEIEVRSPANGEVVGRVPSATVEDLEAAVQSAHAAFRAWSARSAYDREKVLRKAAAHVRTKADEIGRLMALEQGKPLAQARSEVLGACETIEYFAAEGVRVEGFTNPTEDPKYRSTVIYQPVGVCGLITPWNYPVALLSWKLGPALAVGCTCVVKPPSITPMSPLAFCAALLEGGVPAGVINVVTGSGAVVGEALVKHPLVSKVAMTGSTATGKRLMELAGPLLKKISLELGGHCPAIVCADADLDLAAKVIAYKGFRNMGQSCSSVNRVFVQSAVHDAFVQKLAAQAGRLTIGDGLSNPDVDLGPMCDAHSLETVKAHIADALTGGATLVCGGEPPKDAGFEKGNYFLPTVLDRCRPEMLMMKEETFGPVVPVAAFESVEEAVALANETRYGLAAYLFTRDYATTVRAAETLEAGTVCVNHGAVNTNYGPYAGWKESGYGVELSRRAVFEYLKTKHIKVEIVIK